MALQRDKKLKFREFVFEYGGVKEIAKRYSVTEHAVRIWLRGEGTPEVKVIIDIIKESRNGHTKLDFDTIYKECTRNKQQSL